VEYWKNLGEAGAEKKSKKRRHGGSDAIAMTRICVKSKQQC